MAVANTLAYYDRVTITGIKGFIEQAPDVYDSNNWTTTVTSWFTLKVPSPGACTIKLFTVVIFAISLWQTFPA